MDIAELLAFSVKHNASDLHLSAGLPPMIRVDGDIRRINVPVLDHKTVHELVYDIMNDKQRKDYEEFLETDFSFEIPKLARFRVNAYNQNRGSAAVFRTIPSEILTLDDLGMQAIADVTSYRDGLVVITGPSGSGKSSTLAALVGVVGAMQALEAVKYLSGCGDPLRGWLLQRDLARMEVQRLRLPRRPGRWRPAPLVRSRRTAQCRGHDPAPGAGWPRRDRASWPYGRSRRPAARPSSRSCPRTDRSLT